MYMYIQTLLHINITIIIYVSTVVLSIIIGIAMVILPYFGPMRKRKYQFSLSVSTQFDFYQHQSGVENMLQWRAKISVKKSRKACKNRCNTVM